MDHYMKITDATKLQRFCNYFIDFVIFRILLFPVWFVIGFCIGYTTAVLGLTGSGFWEQFIESPYFPLINFVLTMSTFFVYYFVFEATLQQTPGKFITGTRVINNDGTKPSAKTIAIRTLSRLVPFEPFSFLGRGPTGWHDKWTNTAVVRVKRMQQVPSSEQFYTPTKRAAQPAAAAALSENEPVQQRPQEQLVTAGEEVTD